MKRASDTAYERAASLIGAEPAAIRAIFEVEASGKLFNSDGTVPRRFEPHHFPREHWATIGFAPKKGQAAWRASLALRTSRRRAMYEEASKIDAEGARIASSWGAPQIMGFNHRAAGYPTATAMVEAFHDPSEQVAGFVRLIEDWDLDGAIRAHDWYAFAKVYNGPGKARDYAAKIESAYRRASGKSSPNILRVGASGADVATLQESLADLGYLLATGVDGSFGPKTRSAVEEFQASEGLVVDGVVGARTWEAIQAIPGRSTSQPTLQPTAGVIQEERATRALTGASAGGAIVHFLAQQSVKLEIVIGLAVVAVLIFLIARILWRRAEA